MGKYDSITSPFVVCDLVQISNILGPNNSGDRVRVFIVNKVLLSDLAPSRALAVEGANNSGEVIQVPYLEKTATIAQNKIFDTQI